MTDKKNDLTEFEPDGLTEFEPDDAGEFETADPYPPESLSELEKMNEEFTAVIDGGRFRIMRRISDPERPEATYWESLTEDAFRNFYTTPRLERNMDGLSRNSATTIPIGQAWLEWEDRRRAPKGVAFLPKHDPGEIVDGRLNLWCGYGIEPKKGKWTLFRKMILDDLCGGNEEHFSYAIKWLAWKLQNPGLPSGTTIVFKGKEGLGKGTLGETMIECLGWHAMAVSDRGKFTGRFTGHLIMVVFIFADEAVWGGDKQDAGTLKKMITDRHTTYEGKGKDSKPGINRVSFMMATNEEWSVPANTNSRRFAVFETSDKHLVPPTAGANHPNRLYWDAIYDELDNGGRAAFLYDMLEMKLGDWKPRIGVPHTAALAQEVVLGLKGIDRWYFHLLTRGEFPAAVDSVAVETRGPLLKPWSTKGEMMIRGEDAVTACADWLKANKEPYAAPTIHRLSEKLVRLGWRITKHKGKRMWFAPPLPEARDRLTKLDMGGIDHFKAG